ncbi:hypothetical protein EOD39_16699 [Acipenser ruthenus]|uniref:Uncharacterized protein n=1 Tax=Acipenser ruthenus TaxID=7906 RepID=A0A444V595_ACIRT|nr:hypothetical protein EOD39_16699 [Acipenser ruthenus]
MPSVLRHPQDFRALGASAWHSIVRRPRCSSPPQCFDTLRTSEPRCTQCPLCFSAPESDALGARPLLSASIPSGPQSLGARSALGASAPQSQIPSVLVPSSVLRYPQDLRTSEPQCTQCSRCLGAPESDALSAPRGPPPSPPPSPSPRPCPGSPPATYPQWPQCSRCLGAPESDPLGARPLLSASTPSGPQSLGARSALGASAPQKPSVPK